MIADYVRNVRAAHQRVRDIEQAMDDEIAAHHATGTPFVEDDRYHRLGNYRWAAVDARRRAVLGRWSR